MSYPEVRGGRDVKNPDRSSGLLQKQRSISLDHGLEMREHFLDTDGFLASSSTLKKSKNSRSNKTPKLKKVRSSASFSSKKTFKIGSLKRSSRSQPSLLNVDRNSAESSETPVTTFLDITEEELTHSQSLPVTPEIIGTSQDDQKSSKKKKKSKKQSKHKSLDETWQNLDNYPSAKTKRRRFKRSKSDRVSFTLPTITLDSYEEDNTLANPGGRQGTVTIWPPGPGPSQGDRSPGQSLTSPSTPEDENGADNIQTNPDMSANGKAKTMAPTAVAGLEQAAGISIAFGSPSGTRRPSSSTDLPQTSNTAEGGSMDTSNSTEDNLNLSQSWSSSTLKKSDSFNDLKNQAPPKSPGTSRKNSKSRNEKFHKIFKNVPKTEVVIKSYLCAYLGDILLQGYLYVSTNYFCFYTKILGHEKQLEIPIADVVDITREKTALIVPNAIGILTQTEKFVFGSLMSRDSTYRLMQNARQKLNVQYEDFETATDNEGAVSQDSASEDDDDSSASSICTECGTQLSEHEPGNECDNSPTSYLIPDCVPSLCDGDEEMEASTSHHGSERRRLPHHSHEHTQHSGTTSSAGTSRLYGRGSKHVVKHSKENRPETKRMPCMPPLMMTSLIILILVLMSAVWVAYRIISLQAYLEHNMSLVESDMYLHSDQEQYIDLEYLNLDQCHLVTAERLQLVLQANIDLLHQIDVALHADE